MRFEEILIIRHGEILFGIDTATVEQILRVPALTPLALGPEVISGLCAVGGNILTVMDLDRLLGLGRVDAASAESRLLTLTGVHGSVGMLVAQVIDAVEVDPAVFEAIDDPQDAVTALYKHETEIVQILDLERLFEGTGIAAFDAREVKEGASREEQSGRSVTKEERFLLFTMGRERYAVNIEHIREIIAVPERITPIAGSRGEICGRISLRGELLVVADLRRYYGFAAAASDKNRILVVRSEGRHIGLLIDEIIDIRDYLQEEVETVPENFQNGLVAGVIHDEKRLVSLVGKGVLERLFAENAKLLVASDRARELGQAERVMEVVVFRLGETEYAIDIEGVAEIIDRTEVTPIPDAPETVEGVINIRGQVVTIGSLRRKLGLESVHGSEDKIIVCRAGRERIGFFVNGVSDVMDVSAEELRDAGDQGALFSKVLHFDGGDRMVLLFNLERLIPHGRSA